LLEGGRARGRKKRLRRKGAFAEGAPERLMEIAKGGGSVVPRIESAPFFFLSKRGRKGRTGKQGTGGKHFSSCTRAGGESKKNAAQVTLGN